MTRLAAPGHSQLWGHSQFKQHNSVTKGSDSGIQQKLTVPSRLTSTITRPGGQYPCDPDGAEENAFHAGDGAVALPLKGSPRG